jgi:hypothetical protein
MPEAFVIVIEEEFERAIASHQDTANLPIAEEIDS